MQLSFPACANVLAMNVVSQQMVELGDIDAAAFRDVVLAQYRPAVLRGFVRDWPAVARSLESMESIGRYLSAFDSGLPVDALMMAPHVKGRVFYSDDMRGFNFSRDKATITEVTDKLRRYAKFDNRPSLVVQSALIADCLPGFAAENRLAVLDSSVQPRIWLGGGVTTPAHFDESSNVACVVAGTRRFTLFPPEQVRNLYIGPFGHAPTGTPISLASLANADFRKFPRLREALAAAFVAVLEPGDAIYIPALWWHHVQSLAKYNILVNYWWKGSPDAVTNPDTALNCLLHCLLVLRHLPRAQRDAWRALFDHYVFSAEATSFDHIPEHVRGVLGDISPELSRQVKAFLVSQLQR